MITSHDIVTSAKATEHSGPPSILSCELPLDLSATAFGALRATDGDEAADPAVLRRRLEEDGYLYLPGLLGREVVRAARLSVLERAAAEGILDPGKPLEEGILRETINPYFRPSYTEQNAELHKALYAPDGPMLETFTDLFDAPVRHFDFTWLRAVGPGRGTEPHCDIVYMGRGTQDLLTAWTPLGDIPVTLGGLMILEGSHLKTPILFANYLQQDVDTYCANGQNAAKIESGKMNWEHWDGSGRAWYGSITGNPGELRQEIGGRWLTADFRMGDVLIFTMRTIHASIDNQTNRLRLSTDTRYQRADAPIDERWIKGPDGSAPVGHGTAGKRGRIC